MNADYFWTFVTTADRAALMRHGVIVVADDERRQRREVMVTGSDPERTLQLATAHFGPSVDVEYRGETPRCIRPVRCVGHMEREPGRLQVRYALGAEEHMDEVLHAENDETVVVFATACSPASYEIGERGEGPWHVYLDRALGGRVVIDGATGVEVPYRNVWDEIRAEHPELIGE